MNDGKILVAGVGNVFHGDDAFGVFAARELERRPLPTSVDVGDFGLKSYDLAFAILDGYDAVILVDAVSRGEAPGTVYLLDPDRGSVEAGRTLAVGHSMTPDSVLRLLDAFGGYRGKIYVVGCEPATLESKDGRIALSTIVEASVQEAASMVEKLIGELLSENAVLQEEVTKREEETWDES